jgi:hypothetical protein
MKISWNWRVVMLAQYCECIKCYFKMDYMVNFNVM